MINNSCVYYLLQRGWTPRDMAEDQRKHTISKMIKAAEEVRRCILHINLSVK